MSLVAPSVRRSGRWLAEPGFGVYVHIPFCLHRCHYCDFNTYEDLEHLHGAYVDALVAEIERAGRLSLGPATSVFFGGGTPTLLPPRDLGRILSAIDATVGLSPGAEVTVEANPETVDEATFEALLRAGFNRVSIGVQSLAPGVLRALGRTHSVERALDAVAAARRAGVEDLNVDLIYGSVWESSEDWRRSLEAGIEADPDHISAYALTIEEATPLGRLVRQGRVSDVDPDVQAERHALAGELLGAAGYERYETSNWSRPGRACAHNLLYWSAGDYLGFGAGAHGHIAGRRWWNVRLPRDFIARAGSGRSTEADSETLYPEERAAEAMMLGLRLTSGIEIERFAERFGPFLERRLPAIDDLQRRGLIEIHDGHLRVAPSAALVLNEIVCSLL